MNTTGKKVLLASNSPRRKELLSMIQEDYQIAQMHDVDESYPASLAASEVPSFLSRLKADHYKHQLGENEVMLTADTVVILDGKILGKPHSEQEAIDMLLRLSGRTHKVVTGVTLTTTESSETFAETTEVTFKDLSPKEIKDYVDTFRPMDKAGAYGIQEWIGCIGIKGINGCFYNVMGLPLHTLYAHLQKV